MKPVIESRSVRSGSALLRCDEIGAGTLLVFLHAGVADRRSWTPVMRRLADRYRSVAFDRRAFGETEYAAESYSHTLDLRAILDAFDCTRAILVGSSQGGRIAIDFALEQRDRVRALALVAPALSGFDYPEPRSQGAKRLNAAIEKADADGDVERANTLEAHLWLDGPDSNEGRVTGAARELFLDMNGRALRAPDPGSAVEPPPAFERLSDLALPVHVAIGGRDIDILADLGRAIAERVPDGSLTEFRSSAHLPQLEEPEAFADDLERFLQRAGVA